KQISLYEDYLKSIEGADARVYKLYPRDFWMPLRVNGANASTYTDDERHKLFQAVGITQDTDLIIEVAKKLGIIGSNSSPTLAFKPFVEAHYVWAEKNKAWIQEHLSKEKAREYVLANR
ncbi:MAG TPA: hypothetical protein VF766_10260, partial [Pyrinomonadaceae bacterium]